MLLGRAVAHSRKIYAVFAMELDDRLRPTAQNVREIDYYGDYSPTVGMQKDGSVFVHCTGMDETAENAPAVLIPFDVLPKADAHGLTLK